MRKLAVIETADHLSKIESLWNALYIANRDRYTIFQSFACNHVAACIFADREKPYVVVAETDSAAAIIPACVISEGLSFLGEELFDYRDVLSSDEDALAIAWELLAGLSQPLAVKAVRECALWGENHAFAAAPYRPHTARSPSNKALERNLRKLEENRCRFTVISEDAKEGFIRRMYTLKGQQSSGLLFIDPLRVEAVVQMSSRIPSTVFALQRDEQIVASVLTFKDGSVCRFYGTYYDERWAAFSPGVSLLYRVVQDAQAQGLDFDFMTGEQPYKLRFATQLVPLFVAKRVFGKQRKGAVTAA